MPSAVPASASNGDPGTCASLPSGPMRRTAIRPRAGRVARQNCPSGVVASPSGGVSTASESIRAGRPAPSTENESIARPPECPTSRKRPSGVRATPSGRESPVANGDPGMARSDPSSATSKTARLSLPPLATKRCRPDAPMPTRGAATSTRPVGPFPPVVQGDPGRSASDPSAKAANPETAFSESGRVESIVPSFTYR